MNFNGLKGKTTQLHDLAEALGFWPPQHPTESCAHFGQTRYSFSRKPAARTEAVGDGNQRELDVTPIYNDDVRQIRPAAA